MKSNKTYRESLLEEMELPSKAKPSQAFWVFQIMRTRPVSRVSEARMPYGKPLFFSRDHVVAVDEFIKSYSREGGFTLERRAVIDLNGIWFIINMNGLSPAKENLTNQ